MTSPKPSRKTKADLKQNGETFHLLFANHPVPMWIYDLKTLAFLEVNDAALEKYGYARDEFLALTIKDICPADAKRVTRLTHTLEQKRLSLHHSGEWRHCLKNGQVIDVEITTHALDFEGHKAVLVMAQDITERERAEKSLQHNRDLLFALSLASQSIQQARTLEDIYLVVGKEIKALGCDMLICKLGDDGKHLRIVHTTFATNLLRAAEKLTGVKTLSYEMPILPTSIFGRVIAEEKTEYARWTGDEAALVLPKILRPLAGQLVSMVKVERGMVAPLKVDGATIGVLAVTGSTLEEGDVPAVEAFAAQVAISLKNAQLIQQIQKELKERKQAESALKKSEKKYRLLHDSLMDGFVSVGMDGKFWDCNEVYRNMLGYSEAELAQLTYIDITPEKWHAYETDIVENQIMKRGYSDIYEKEYRREDGTIFPVELHTVLSRDEHGNPISMWAITRDITERKQAEDALRESVMKLAQSQRIGKLGSWDWDTVENSLDWSDEVYRIWGVGKDFHLTFENIAGMIHPDNRELNSKMVEEFLAQNNEGGFEFRIICPDGTIKYIYQSIEVTRAPDGQPIKMFGIMQDITGRKQAEENLIASEVRYRRLFEAARDGVLLLDAETGVILDVNPFLCEMLGFSHEEICGKELWELGFFKDIAESKANFLELQEKGYIRYDDLPLEIASGRKFHVEFISNVYNVNHHKVVQCNIRDITERKQAEQKLAQYSEHLEEMVQERTSELRETQEKLVRNEKLAVLGQLAGGVGHELRNPLAVINNALYYLKLIGADSSEKVKEYLGIIETEAHTAEKIITDLLDFARIKSVDREPVSACELVHLTLNRFPVHPSVQVTLEIPEELPKVYVDPRQMGQVLGNLVINACQAMTTGGGSTDSELVISAYQDQEMIAIAVKDSGVGIPPENMEKIFEPLFTTKAKGIGLGLAVSQKLVEANGGRLEVQSEAGVGSTFTLILPVKQNDT